MPPSLTPNAREKELGNDFRTGVFSGLYFGDSLNNVNGDAGFVPYIYGMYYALPAGTPLGGITIGNSTGNTMPGGTANIQIAGGNNTMFTGNVQTPVNDSTPMSYGGADAQVNILGMRCDWQISGFSVNGNPSDPDAYASATQLPSAGRSYSIIVKNIQGITAGVGDWLRGKTPKLELALYSDAVGTPATSDTPNGAGRGIIDTLRFRSYNDFDGDGNYTTEPIAASNAAVAQGSGEGYRKYTYASNGVSANDANGQKISFEIWGPTGGGFDQRGQSIIFGAPSLYIQELIATGVYFDCAGIGGYRAQDAVDRHSATSFQRWRESRPRLAKWFFCWLGQNMTAAESASIGTLWKANIETICLRAQTAGYSPVLVATPQVDSAGRWAQMQTALRELRALHGWPLMDLIEAAGRMDQVGAYLADGVHANQAGSVYIAQKQMEIFAAWADSAPIVYKNSNLDAFILPSADALPVTKSDAVSLPFLSREILCNGAGDLRVTTQAGNIVTIPVLAGAKLDLAVSKIWATGTTATGITVFF